MGGNSSKPVQNTRAVGTRVPIDVLQAVAMAKFTYPGINIPNAPPDVRKVLKFINRMNAQGLTPVVKNSSRNDVVTQVKNIIRKARNPANKSVVGVPVTATGVPAPASYANILKKYGFSDEYTIWARRTNQPTIRKFINEKNKTVNSRQPNLNKALANLRAKMTYKKYNIKSTTNFNELEKLRRELVKSGRREENIASMTLQQLRNSQNANKRMILAKLKLFSVNTTGINSLPANKLKRLRESLSRVTTTNAALKAVKNSTGLNRTKIQSRPINRVREAPF
jgi:hypothetical protein